MTKIKKKDIQMCPVCGKTVQEQLHWVSCPQVNMPICMSHCLNKCKFLRKGTSIIRCIYKHKFA